MDNNVNKQYRQMAKHYRGKEAIITPNELKGLFSYIEDMEKNMLKLTSELEKLNAKMEQGTTRNRKNIKEDKDFLQEMRTAMEEMKSRIVEKGEDIKTCVHDKNLEGLHSILEKLNLKELMNKILEFLNKALERNKMAQEKASHVGDELGKAMGHLDNLKDMSGEELPFEKWRLKKQEDVLGIMRGRTDEALAKLEKKENILEGIKDKTENFQAKLANLDKRVGENKAKGMEKISESLTLNHSPRLGMQR
ncbi:hypothetical protein Ami103574_10760 [Aminipila butyrica]|uniref:Uncharacterized protein n=1 Tax=Aminipila butyrica TaxID=433296 RepID=A0A858BXY1_9FIRM|nr:DUF6674 family protein [Aminipila butyrica]QIB69770.1 hypothetical protein Ami103574_10760 [Aminipila butyrica]